MSISFNKKKGTLRGMHYQTAPFAEAKLVRCIRGALFDVIIDLRPDSPTFTHNISVVLSVENRPAAGFRVLMADRKAAGEFLGEAVKKELPLRFGRTDLMRAFAGDVADLLDSGAEIDGRPIGPSDIAVLCRRKSELAQARRALEALGIPCVDRGDSDVFESREAWELASVMRAMLRPGDSAILRGGRPSKKRREVGSSSVGSGSTSGLLGMRPSVSRRACRCD